MWALADGKVSAWTLSLAVSSLKLQCFLRNNHVHRPNLMHATRTSMLKIATKCL